MTSPKWPTRQVQESVCELRHRLPSSPRLTASSCAAKYRKLVPVPKASHSSESAGRVCATATAKTTTSVSTIFDILKNLSNNHFDTKIKYKRCKWLLINVIHSSSRKINVRVDMLSERPVSFGNTKKVSFCLINIINNINFDINSQNAAYKYSCGRVQEIQNRLARKQWRPFTVRGEIFNSYYYYDQDMCLSCLISHCIGITMYLQIVRGRCVFVTGKIAYAFLSKNKTCRLSQKSPFFTDRLNLVMLIYNILSPVQKVDEKIKDSLKVHADTIFVMFFSSIFTKFTPEASRSQRIQFFKKLKESDESDSPKRNKIRYV
ncbi:hypothetical protein GQR58_023765 [Nymphon striatum]|nr:hypothetical protein GQR58_023765 [Nymphon striatum]